MLYRNYTKIYNSNRMLQKICNNSFCPFFTIILIFSQERRENGFL